MAKFIITISLEATSEEDAVEKISKVLSDSEVEVLAGPNEDDEEIDEPLSEEEES